MNTEYRSEYETILRYIAHNTSVADLGCGNGSLLSLLQQRNHCTVKGIELSPSGVSACINKGLDVIEGTIDTPLPWEDNSFDYAVCNVTVQMVMYPELLLKEMRRIAQRQIVSFPNFGFYKNRLDLLFHGRMPQPMLFGYQWYSTGHIHQLSMKDFYELINNVGGLRVEAVLLQQSSFPPKNLLMQIFPNLFQILPVFVLQKIYS